MLSIQPLILAAALTATTHVEMLEFTAAWCGPCQQMKGTIDRIRSMGYRVRSVDFDRERELVQRFRVSQVPTYVFVVNGREVDRIVGAVSAERLLRVFHQDTRASEGGSVAGPRSPSGLQRTPGTVPVSAVRSERSNPASRPSSDSAVERSAVQSTVRLRVDDASGHSYGTGTIIHVRENDALVLSCGHIFRDSKGKGQIKVDLFAPGPDRTVGGELIRYDLDRDVALIGIKTRNSMRPAQLAGPDYVVRPGQPVFSVGCNRGQNPTLMRGSLTAVNKYLGPSNLTATGQPVDGRSGGGLFTPQGYLVGVCNAADPEANEGLYAAFPSIHKELDRSNLSFVYNTRPQIDAVAARGQGTWAKTASLSHPDRRQTGGPTPSGRSHPAPTSPGLGTPIPRSGQEVASFGHEAVTMAQDVEQAEVICIIRSPGEPQADRLIVLDRPSRDFMHRLQQEDTVHQTRRNTEMRIGRRLGHISAPSLPQHSR